MQQWRSVTYETGHVLGMPKLVMQLDVLWVLNGWDMQYFTGRVGQKIVWDSKTSTNFCRKIKLFLKK